MAEELTKRYGANISLTKGSAPDVDLWIDAAGVPSLIQTAVDDSKYTAAISVLAVYKKNVELDLKTLMYNSLSLKGSVMFTLEEVKDSFAMIHENKDIAQTMISHTIPFEDAAEAFMVADNPDLSLKVMMTSKE